MSAPVRTWLTEPVSVDVQRSLDRLAAAPGVIHVAAMPDVHLARDVCVGVAVATLDRLIPAAVGGDIGCGMAALALDADADLLASEARAGALLHALYGAVPCLKQRRPPALPRDLAESPLSDKRLEQARARDGRYQLGTLGRGNHFVELQADEADRLWLMVHTGSRGMGARIRDHHVRRADEDPASRLAFLRAESPAGRAYLADHAWALRYAEANRAAIVRAVVRVLHEQFGVASDPATGLACHHNFVRHERFAGGAAYVHRKGAISADDGEVGIVPGSMGAASFHTLGRGLDEALRSSSHGAGRAMRRTDARRRIRVAALEDAMEGVWFDHRRSAALRDEAPMAYRDIHAVMRAQRDLTRVIRRLRPLLAFKY